MKYIIVITDSGGAQHTFREGPGLGTGNPIQYDSIEAAQLVVDTMSVGFSNPQINILPYKEPE